MSNEQKIYIAFLIYLAVVGVLARWVWCKLK
jgi:hypothetical protein